jgi:hypothetical protein
LKRRQKSKKSRGERANLARIVGDHNKNFREPNGKGQEQRRRPKIEMRLL